MELHSSVFYYIVTAKTTDSSKIELKMCQQWEMVLHCYECQKEYYRGPQQMPCPDVSEGRPCRQLVCGGQVLTNGETCNKCQEMRRVEEICQQNIYRMKPLYYNLDKKRAIWESYW